MTGKTVLITGVIPEAGLVRLDGAGLDVRLSALPRPMRPEELVRAVGSVDAVLCQGTDRINETILRASRPHCRIFANCAVGYDNIDVAAASRHGIVVTNTPDVLTEATADLTWALLLATARRLGEAERVVRARAWRGWSMLDFLGADLCGKTLGIIGAGRIGTAVARRAAGFSMALLYANRSERKEMEALGGRRVGLTELLDRSDFVSLHVPLTDATRRLIDEAALRRMRRHAILINTSRGAVIDEAALVRALREGWIAAAGLDVYENEPQVTPELLEMENVVLLPHIGSATAETRSRMAELAASNVIAVLRGEPPLTPVAPPSSEPERPSP